MHPLKCGFSDQDDFKILGKPKATLPEDYLAPRNFLLTGKGTMEAQVYLQIIMFEGELLKFVYGILSGRPYLDHRKSIPELINLQPEPLEFYK